MLSKIVPRKSPNDKLEYLAGVLQNKLQVILVSDPDTQQSAATMCVRCGSLEDPKDLQGLAHFLEHMLFMGSANYPDAGAYRKFVTENGGDSNAYTSLDETVYYFNIVNAKFREGLSMFSSFFTCTQLSKDCVDAEINAVNSEHEKNLTSDAWKEFQLTRHLSRAASPLNGFSTGNLDTLKKPSVYSELRNFYDQKYSANIMRLVLYGKEPVEALEKVALELFDGVPNRGIPPFSYNRPDFMALAPEDMGRVVRFQTESKVMRIKFSWQFSFLPEEWDKDPFKLFSHIIGHESSGSLLSGLKSERLAFNLSAGASPTADVQNNFEVTIGLTENGWKNLPRVVQYVGNYINMLRTQTGIPKSVFDEVRIMNEIKFRYQEKKAPIDKTTDLACRRLEIPLDLVLEAPYLLTDYEEHRYKRILEEMTLEKSFIILANDTFEEPLDLVEPIYKSKYSVENIPAEWFKSWNKPADETFYRIRLPETNVFIPQRFELHPLEIPKRVKPSVAPVQAAEAKKEPVKPVPATGKTEVKSAVAKDSKSTHTKDHLAPPAKNGAVDGHKKPATGEKSGPNSHKDLQKTGKNTSKTPTKTADKETGDKNSKVTKPTTAPNHKAPEAHAKPAEHKETAPQPKVAAPVSPTTAPQTDPTLPVEYEPVYPERLSSTQLGVTWFKQDDTFLIPKIVHICYIYYDMESLASYNETRVYARFWTDLLTEYLNEFTYLASMANLKADNIPGRRGFTLTITGYSDSFKTFLPEYGVKLRNFVSLTKTPEGREYLSQEFLNQKEKALIKERKRRNREPFRIAYEALDGIFLHNVDSEVEWLARLERATVENYLAFHEQIFSRNYYEELFLGNIVRSEALAMSSDFYRNFLSLDVEKALPIEDITDNKVAKLPEHTTFVLHKEVFNKKELNSNLMLIYQAEVGYESRFLCQLAAMLIEDKFFEDLRTTQQLGYVVMSGYNDRKDVFNIFFLVQSQILTPSEVAGRVYKFLDDFRETFTNIPADIFENIQNALISDYKKKLKTLGSEATFYWDHIQKHTYEFDFKLRAVETVKRITRSQLNEFMKGLLYQRKRILEVHSTAQSTAQKNKDHLQERIKLLAAPDKTAHAAENRKLIPVKNEREFKKLVEFYPDFHTGLGRQTTEGGI